MEHWKSKGKRQNVFDLDAPPCEVLMRGVVRLGAFGDELHLMKHITIRGPGDRREQRRQHVVLGVFLPATAAV